ncbi:hypothetical protein [Aquisphaera insulae]|uniref:hypothetical protein n=1 Tax=Aquisphaera insulae TaxID=2712864 RepID=UPI0013EDBB61|nr:hypothetical protein [Aquisphaera insulae]
MRDDPGRIQDVFWATLQLSDPADRARFLERACLGDGELHHRVEALLEAHDAVGGPLSTPIVGPWILDLLRDEFRVRGPRSRERDEGGRSQDRDGSV